MTIATRFMSITPLLEWDSKPPVGPLGRIKRGATKMFRLFPTREPPYSTSTTSTATPSFCLGDPTMMPSTGETSEKSRPMPSMM
jgi:hypothetical protein